MEQVAQLKAMHAEAQARLEQSRNAIKQQLLAIENSADAKLVKSLGTLISDLELMSSTPAQATAPAQLTKPIATPVQAAAPVAASTPSLDNVAHGALADALGATAEAPVAPASLSDIADQLRGTMNS